jgi:hypothetical protein
MCSTEHLKYGASAGEFRCFAVSGPLPAQRREYWRRSQRFLTVRRGLAELVRGTVRTGATDIGGSNTGEVPPAPLRIFSYLLTIVERAVPWLLGGLRQSATNPA